MCGILPILFERINMLWHTGSHNCFPFRYGFIPIFIMLNCGMYYITKYLPCEKKFEKIDIFLIILALVPITVLTPRIVLSINSNDPAFKIEVADCIVLCIQTIMCAFVIDKVLKIENKKVRNSIISVIVIFQIIIQGLAYIGVPEERRGGPEHSDSSITVANELIQAFNSNKTTLYRYKDLDQSMTENYPLVLDWPSISTFLHIISKEQVLTHSQLGYTRNNTKFGDCGGTLASDEILGIKYSLSKNELDSEIYQKNGTAKNGINLYEYKEMLPYGIVYENNKDISTIPEKFDVFETQNEKTEDDENKVIYKYTMRVNEKSYLYLYGNEGENLIYKIIVNGETVTIPWINNQNNTWYSLSSNNGIINLGKFENQDVEVETISYKGRCNLKFATLPLEKFENFVASYNESITKEINIENNKIKIKVENAKAGQKLFLPITYDTGWNGVNNGETQGINRVFNTYVSLDLKEGTNEIELTFIPAKMKLGIELSIATLVIILVYTFGIKKLIRKDGILDKIIVNLGLGIYIIITVGFYFKVYLMCIIQTIKQWIG